MKSDKRSTIASERRAQAFGLRRAGYTFQMIGDQVGISKQGAHGLVMRELKRLTKEAEDDAHELRAMELERLDALTQACWEKAMDGDPQMIDKLLRISERRARFLGLDAPLKTAIDLLNTDVRIYLPDNGRDEIKPNSGGTT